MKTASWRFTVKDLTLNTENEYDDIQDTTKTRVTEDMQMLMILNFGVTWYSVVDSLYLK